MHTQNFKQIIRIFMVTTLTLSSRQVLSFLQPPTFTTFRRPFSFSTSLQFHSSSSSLSSFTNTRRASSRTIISRGGDSNSIPPPFARLNILHPSLISSSFKMPASSSSSTELSSSSSTTILPSEKEAFQHILDAISSSSSSNIIKCGELACQVDSYQQTLEHSNLISFAPFQDSPSQSTKKKKKKKKNSKRKTEKYNAIKYAITLSDSIFYPEGGGQPHDTGLLQISSTEEEEKDEAIELIVIKTTNVNSYCILTCATPISSTLTSEEVISILSCSSTTPKLNIIQKLDWNRRVDLMTQHSAQHLISAIALAEPFCMDTHSFKLSADDEEEDDDNGDNVAGKGGSISSNTCYVDLVSDKTNYEESCRKIEDIINDKIAQNLKMTPRYMDPASSSQEEEHVRSRLLPENFTGKLRLVEIGGGGDNNGNIIDCNTCAGTHVQSLSLLQQITFYRIERVKSSVIRIHFAASKRARRINANITQRDVRINDVLSCQSLEQVERIEGLLEEKRRLEREVKVWKDFVCEGYGREIMKELKNNNKVVLLDVGELGVGDMSIIGQKVMDDASSSMEDVLILLIGGSSCDSDQGCFYLTGDESLVAKSGKLVAQMLDGRGGGKGGKFQGKGNKVRSGLKDVQDMLMQMKREG